MFSTQTKQVNAYGKRGRRVVDVSVTNAQPLSKGIFNIFEDLPPPPAWAPIASRMKGRENATPKQKAPKVVGMQRRKRLSPVLSPIKKHMRVSQLLKESNNSVGSGSQDGVQGSKPKAKPLPLGKPGEMFDSPPRAPLSSFSINVPGSPSVPTTRKMKARAPPKGSSNLSKPVPAIVDIIVLDDEGRTISQERRVSHRRGEPRPANTLNGPQVRKPIPRLPIHVDSGSESEQPKLDKRLKKRATRVVVTDESESDAETSALPAVPTKAVTGTKPASKHLERAVAIEVVVPPAPYSTKEVPRLASLPKVGRPTTPPKPRANIITTIAPVFKLPASPIFKNRQLTPIRGGRTRGLFEPPSPPSPSTSDLDLSLDFSDLSLYSEEISGSSFIDQSIPEYLKPILAECHQEDCGPHEFSSFIESFPFDPILQSKKAGRERTFKKIGEASYSEVFGIGDVVLKVIPLRDELPSTGKQHTLKLAARGTLDDQDLGDDVPPPSDVQDVRKEIIVTRAMGEVHHGFVKLLKTYIVKGKYPEMLLNLWDEYNEQKGSESIRPATFDLSQVYAIIVLPNGGPDLEAYSFSTPSKSGWRQASSVFWQVAKSLAHAEHLVSFEHRDLHWGQILVKNVSSQKPKLKAINMNSGVKARSQKRVTMDDLEHGVQATIIDLGLSRMDAGDGSGANRVQWTPFDKEVFMGEGDYQFDVYRMMRALTGEKWEDYHPVTNIMWLHYLLTKLLRSKGLKVPGATRKTKGLEASLPSTEISGFSERDCYECLLDLEQWLGQTLRIAFPAKAGAKGKSRKATTSVRYEGPESAGEIVEYGVKKRWIRASTLF